MFCGEISNNWEDPPISVTLPVRPWLLGPVSFQGFFNHLHGLWVLHTGTVEKIQEAVFVQTRVLQDEKQSPYFSGMHRTTTTTTTTTNKELDIINGRKWQIFRIRFGFGINGLTAESISFSLVGCWLFPACHLRIPVSHGPPVSFRIKISIFQYHTFLDSTLQCIKSLSMIHGTANLLFVLQNLQLRAKLLSQKDALQLNEIANVAHLSTNTALRCLSSFPWPHCQTAVPWPFRCLLHTLSPHDPLLTGHQALAPSSSPMLLLIKFRLVRLEFCFEASARAWQEANDLRNTMKHTAHIRMLHCFHTFWKAFPLVLIAQLQHPTAFHYLIVKKYAKFACSSSHSHLNMLVPGSKKTWNNKKSMGHQGYTALPICYTLHL